MQQFPKHEAMVAAGVPPTGGGAALLRAPGRGLHTRGRTGSRTIRPGVAPAADIPANPETKRLEQV